MQFRALIEKTAAELGAEVEFDADDAELAHLSVSVSDSDDGDGDREQTVSVYTDGEVVVAFHDAGPYSEDLASALPDVLRGLGPALFTRVYIAEDEDEGEESLAVEAGALLEGLPVASFAAMVQEVADVADALVNELFAESEE